MLFSMELVCRTGIFALSLLRVTRARLAFVSVRLKYAKIKNILQTRVEYVQMIFSYEPVFFFLNVLFLVSLFGF